MKYFYTLLIVFMLQSCSTIETFTTWVSENDESMVIVRIATAEAVYSGDYAGSGDVCSRANSGSEIITKARSILDNDVLSMGSLDSQLSQLLTDSGVSPVTVTILLEIASNTVREYQKQVSIGAIPYDAKVTLNSMLDAANSVIVMAKAGC